MLVTLYCGLQSVLRKTILELVMLDTIFSVAVVKQNATLVIDFDTKLATVAKICPNAH